MSNNEKNITDKNTAIGKTATVGEVAAALSTAPEAVIIAHARPDGDALGSAFALADALKQRSIPAYVVCADQPPRRLRFITGYDSSLELSDLPPSTLVRLAAKLGENSILPSASAAPLETKESLMDGELVTSSFAAERAIATSGMGLGSDTFSEEQGDPIVVSVDTAEESLMGSLEPIFSGRVDIKIDHHYNGSPFAALNLIDESASSCGEMIFEISKRLGKIDSDAANKLYAAISSDTGSFKYSNVTNKTFEAAAELVALGANPAWVSSRLFGQRTGKDIAALALALGSIRYFCNGRVAMVSISRADKEKAGLCDDDLGEIASVPRDIEGVDVGVMIRQTDGGEGSDFKISMRGSECADVSRMCEILGGGGHIRAAGATVNAGDMEKAEEKVLEAICAVLDKADGCK